MRAVADFISRQHLLLIADEAYDHLVYDGLPMISAGGFQELPDRLLIVNTCSETFAMTGWRVGYLAARSGLVRGPSLVHRTSCGFVNTTGQRAAVAAYTRQANSTARTLDEYAARRNLMCGMVNACRACAANSPKARSTCSFGWKRESPPRS